MRGQSEHHGGVWFQGTDSQTDRAEGRKMKTHQPGCVPHRSVRSHLRIMLDAPDVVPAGPQPLHMLPSLPGLQRPAWALSWVQRHFCPLPSDPLTGTHCLWQVALHLAPAPSGMLRDHPHYAQVSSLTCSCPAPVPGPGADAQVGPH